MGPTCCSYVLRYTIPEPLYLKFAPSRSRRIQNLYAGSLSSLTYIPISLEAFYLSRSDNVS